MSAIHLEKIQSWRRHYNVSRPHMALNHLTPRQYRASEPNLTSNPNFMTGT
ncbi:MAG: transposase [Candidatus Glassbacteria bacterium]|nr:transposase [Candidatus Glassbacteria bacterium]